jgi:ketosteroid isomerase-like protein
VAPTDVEVVKGAYEAFARGDVAGVLERLDPKVEWKVSDALPFGGTYRGREQVGAFFAKLPSYFQTLTVTTTDFVASGGRVVALGTIAARGRGGAVEAPFAMAWTLRGGKAVAFEEHQDTAKILKAIG